MYVEALRRMKLVEINETQMGSVVDADRSRKQQEVCLDHEPMFVSVGFLYLVSEIGLIMLKLFQCSFFSTAISSE